MVKPFMCRENQVKLFQTLWFWSGRRTGSFPLHTEGFCSDSVSGGVNNENHKNGHETSHFADGGDDSYEDDFKNLNNDDQNRCQLEDDGSLVDKTIVLEISNNNNYNNNNFIPSTGTFALGKCQRPHTVYDGGSHDFISSPQTILGDCLNVCLHYFAPKITCKNVTKLLIILNLKMGTSCSSNFYDRREWNHMENGSSIDATKHRKPGRYFRKRAQSDPTSDTTHIPPDACTCRQEGNNSTEGGHGIGKLFFQGNTSNKNHDYRASLSPNDIYDTISAQMPNNRLSPNMNSSGHVRLSRVVGSGRARVTTKCDVSPHRLLTRRTNSPHYRATNLDSRSTNTYPGPGRQRSLSWANSKFGTTESLRGTSPALGASFLCPLRTAKGSSTQTSANVLFKSPQAVSTTLSHYPAKSIHFEDHQPECPLHASSSEIPKISITKKQSKLLDDDSEDWSPITRRRAASESHTTQPHRLFPHATESTDLNHSHDHAHVHWADEEKGSSLSTSVFLSSIRPRSYSHGAMDNVPHRPILKKLAGL